MLRQLRVEPTGVTVELRAGESMLGALARQGYAHRSGCRRGGCGICKVRLVSGEVEYPVEVSEQALSQDERASGLSLSCRGVPATDVVIQLDGDDTLRCVAPMLAALAKQKAKENSR